MSGVRCGNRQASRYRLGRRPGCQEALDIARKPAPEIIPGRDIVQVFAATEDDLAAIAPLVGTYAREVQGELRFSLHRVVRSGPSSNGSVRRLWSPIGRKRQLGPYGTLGRELASHTEMGADLRDNEPVEFMFEPQAGSGGQLFALRISARGTSAGNGATVWLSDGAERTPGHLACYLGGRPVSGHGVGFGVAAEALGAPAVAVSSVPSGFLYSPVTQCNLNCIHCISRHTRTTARRLPGWFKEQLTQWCRDGLVTSLACDYSGDILWADARFGGELDYVIDLDIPFQIDTNGVCLTREVARRLMSSRLYALNVSLDAATESTYRRVRRGGPPLSEVTDHVSEYMAVHEACGAEFPVSLSFVLMRSTLDEWPAFVRLAARLGVRLVQTRHLESYTPDMDHESLWLDQARFNDAREMALRTAADVGVQLVTPPPFSLRAGRGGHRLCRAPWESAAVFGNGDVAACCVPGMTMGNLHSESLEDIWNGPNYQALRRAVNSPAPPAPCSACPFMRRHDNPGAYLFHRAVTARNGSEAADC